MLAALHLVSHGCRILMHSLATCWRCIGAINSSRCWPKDCWLVACNDLHSVLHTTSLHMQQVAHHVGIHQHKKNMDRKCKDSSMTAVMVDNKEAAARIIPGWQPSACAMQVALRQALLAFAAAAAGVRCHSIPACQHHRWQSLLAA